MLSKSADAGKRSEEKCAAAPFLPHSSLPAPTLTRCPCVPPNTMRSRRRTRGLPALLTLACLLPLALPSTASLVSAVEAVTRGIGAKLQEFKGGEGLVVSPADIEGLLNTPCGE